MTDECEKRVEVVLNHFRAKEKLNGDSFFPSDKFGVAHYDLFHEGKVYNFIRRTPSESGTNSMSLLLEEPFL